MVVSKYLTVSKLGYNLFRGLAVQPTYIGVRASPY